MTSNYSFHPFLISRGFKSDYRLIASTKLVSEKNLSSLLIQATDISDVTQNGCLVYGQIKDNLSGDLTLVFRISNALESNIQNISNSEHSSVLRDAQGRAIVRIDGLISFSSIAPTSLKITEGQFQVIYDALAHPYKKFWNTDHITQNLEIVNLSSIGYTGYLNIIAQEEELIVDQKPLINTSIHEKPKPLSRWIKFIIYIVLISFVLFVAKEIWQYPDKKFKKADLETKSQLLKIADKDKDKILSLIEIQEIPCKEFVALDDMWEKKSDQKFSFSNQLKIWEESNNQLSSFLSNVNHTEKSLFRDGSDSFEDNSLTDGYFPTYTFLADKDNNLEGLEKNNFEDSPEAKLKSFFTRFDKCKTEADRKSE